MGYYDTPTSFFTRMGSYDTPYSFFRLGEDSLMETMCSRPYHPTLYLRDWHSVINLGHLYNFLDVLLGLLCLFAGNIVALALINKISFIKV